MTNTIENMLNDPDSVLNSIYWMAEEAKLYLPPLPETYLDRFIEVSVGTTFSTDLELAGQLGKTGIDATLQAGIWPNTGLAFQLVGSGRWLYWNYLFVGRNNLIQVNISTTLSADQRFNPLSPISAANRRLSEFLSDEVALSRYLATGSLDGDAVAHITRYENTAGAFPEEVQQTWSATAGLSAPRATRLIFNDGSGNQISTGEEVIIHP
jgi:hypothetical protein